MTNTPFKVLQTLTCAVLLSGASTLLAQTPASPAQAAPVSPPAFNPFAGLVQAAPVVRPLSPGYWTVTTRPEMQGPPMPVPPKITNLCITPMDVAMGRVLIPSMPACNVDGGTWEGATLSLKLACKGLPAGATVSGELQAADKAFSGTVIVVLQPSQEGANRGHITYHETGQWMAADCPGAPPFNPLTTGK